MATWQWWGWGWGGCDAPPFPWSRSGQAARVTQTRRCLLCAESFRFLTSYLSLSLPHLISLPHPLLSFCPAKVTFRAFPMLGTYSITELPSLALIFVLFLFWRQSHHLIQAGFKLSMQSRLSGSGLWEYYPTLCSKEFRHSYVPECTCKHFSWHIIGYPPLFCGGDEQWNPLLCHLADITPWKFLFEAIRHQTFGLANLRQKSQPHFLPFWRLHTLIKFIWTRWKIAGTGSLFVTLVQEFNFQPSWLYDKLGSAKA